MSVYGTNNKKGLVSQLREAASSQSTLTGDAWLADLLCRAADEIEYLKDTVQETERQARRALEEERYDAECETERRLSQREWHDNE